MLILVVDDHPLYRDALTRLLAQLFPGVEVRQASDYRGALTSLRDGTGIDIVVLDLDLPDLPGRDPLVHLREAFPDTRVVIVSATETRDEVMACLQAGASGFIPKSAPTDVLAAALALVRDGGVYLPSLLLEADADHAQQMSGHSATPQRVPAHQQSDERLTPREAEVLVLLCQGLANKAIANALGMSEATVRTHLTSVFRTLGVVNRTQAAREARRRHWVPDDL